MTPQEFVATWKNVTQTERATSQTHFNHLCQLLDVDDPITGDPTGQTYAFEPGVRKAGDEAELITPGGSMVDSDDCTMTQRHGFEPGSPDMPRYVYHGLTLHEQFGIL